MSSSQSTNNIYIEEKLVRVKNLYCALFSMSILFIPSDKKTMGS